MKKMRFNKPPHPKDVFIKLWDKKKPEDKLLDVVEAAMEEFAAALRDEISNLEDEVRDPEDFEVYELIRALQKKKLDADEAAELEEIISEQSGTLVDAMKNNAWNEAKNRLTLEEIEFRLK